VQTQKTFLRDRTVFPVEVIKHGSRTRDKGKPGPLAKISLGATN
jgi:hypothetical protein